jgi:ribosomal protein L7/L12
MDTAEIASLRQALARLEDKVDYLYRYLNLDYQAPAPAYEAEAQALLRQRRDIDAIKLVRQHTNLGLAEAKAIIDELKRRM